jgi:hypothetical protein
MSTHNGWTMTRAEAGTLKITTTLYDLVEAMGEHLSSLFDRGDLAPGTGKRRPDPVQERMIAARVAGMFSSGRLRFKHPWDVRMAYPEWFD